MFGLSSRTRGADAQGARDDLDKYESLFPAGGGGEKGKGKVVDRDAEHVRIVTEMRDMEEVASLDKRWTSSWKQPLLAE